MPQMADAMQWPQICTNWTSNLENSSQISNACKDFGIFVWVPYAMNVQYAKDQVQNDANAMWTKMHQFNVKNVTQIVTFFSMCQKWW